VAAENTSKSPARFHLKSGGKYHRIELTTICTVRRKAHVKSSHSNPNGECVEVAVASDESGDVVVWDSKHPTGAALRFTKAEWDAFLKGALDGEFAYENLPTLQVDMHCPTCGKDGDEECVTRSGRLYGVSHARRPNPPEYRQHPTSVLLFGVRPGTVPLVGKRAEVSA
jgi:hypothetical protein